jgi:hypothetical protein
MLAMANRDGIVEGSVPGLAHQARVPVDKCRDALLVLSGPDPDSRTPDHEGRRIRAVDGGWLLLTYQKHRERMTIDERRTYKAVKQQEYRDRNRRNSGQNSRQRGPAWTDVEPRAGSGHKAEAEVEEDQELRSPAVAGPDVHEVPQKPEPTSPPIDGAIFVLWDILSRADGAVLLTTLRTLVVERSKELWPDHEDYRNRVVYLAWEPGTPLTRLDLFAVTPTWLSRATPKE